MLKRSLIFVLLCQLQIGFHQTFGQSATCQAGISTAYDGFQKPFLSSAYFNESSSAIIASPFIITNGIPDTKDLYFSLWFRFSEAQSEPKGTLLQCYEAQRTSNISLELRVGSITKIQYTFLQEESATIEHNQQLKRWNHLAFHVNQENQIKVILNGVVIGNKQANIDKAAYNFFNLHLWSLQNCQFGSEGFNGYLRHIIVAQGLNTTEEYLMRYKHNLPTPIDLKIVSFLSFERNLLKNYLLNQMDQLGTSGITFQNSNEPDQICQCSNSTFSSFAQTSPINGFDPVEQLFIRTKINSVTIAFSIKIEEIFDDTYSEIMMHQDFWSIGVIDKRYLQVNISDQKIKIEIPKYRQSIFTNYWITYQIRFTSTNLTMSINDHTNSPLVATFNFTNTLINLETPNFIGSFNLYTHGLTANFHYLNYTVNSETLLYYDLTFKNFYQTKSITTLTTTLAREPIDGYFSYKDKMLQSRGGIRFIQDQGPCNQSDPNFQFDGLVCKNQQRYMAFYQSPNQAAEGKVEAMLPSTNGQFTFETWFKFNGFSLSNQKQSTIMANYQVLDYPLVQIAIVKSSTGSLQIKCDPNAKSASQSLIDSVFITDGMTQDQWIHFSCVSNIEDNILRGYLFNWETEQLSKGTQVNSHFATIPNMIPIRTVIGNTYDEKEPFKGFIRDLRMWKVSKSESQLAQLRFQSLPLNALREDLLVNNMLNQGYGDRVFENSYQLQQTTALYSLSMIAPISWIEDKDLTICPPDTIFNQDTSCCIIADFQTSLTRIMSTSEDGTNNVLLELQISETYSVSTLNIDNYNNTWIVDSIRNYGSVEETQSHIRQIQTIVDNQQSNKNRRLWIPRGMLSNNASYTFKAITQSLMKNSNSKSESYLSYQPECPSLKITPDVIPENNYRLSVYMDPALFPMKLHIIDQCVDPISITNIEWITTTLPNLYQISADKKNLTFKRFLGPMQINITAEMSYKRSNSDVIEKIFDNATIKLFDLPFDLKIKDIARKRLPTDDIIFDASSTKININYPQDPQIKYILECPTYLFEINSKMQEVCKPSITNGYAKIKQSDTSMALYQDYVFFYKMYSDVLGFNQTRKFVTSYYSNLFFLCPSMRLNPWTYFSKSLDNFIIKSDLKIDCLSSFTDPKAIVTNNNLTNVKWQVEGFGKAEDFLDIQQNGIVATIKQSAKGKLAPGFTTQVTISAKINDQEVSSKTKVSIQKSTIEIILTENFENDIVPFNQTMILNISQSYDPDNRTSILQQSWKCPSLISQINCDKFAKNDSFIMSPFDRIDSGIGIGEFEIFEVKITNPDYPDYPQTKQAQFQFQNHDQKRKPKLDCSIIIQGTQNAYYSKVNATDHTIVAYFDSLNCNTQLIVKGQLYSYVPSEISSQSNQNYQKSQSVTISKDQIIAMSVGASHTIDFIYLYSYLDQNNILYDYIVKSVTITRTPSTLIALLSPNKTIEVGQDSSFDLDASLSYDPDDINNKKFIFQWYCPGFTCDFFGPKLTVTKQMREEGSQNDIDNEFDMGVEISSGNKRSIPIYVKVKIIEQDQSQCLEVKLQNSETNQIGILRDQELPIQIRLKIIEKCTGIQIEKIEWASTSGSEKFWEDSEKGDFISIVTQDKIPIKQTIDMIVKIRYIVNGVSRTSTQNMNYIFSIKLESSRLVPLISTNLGNSKIYFYQSKVLEFKSSDSYDPNDPTQELSCQWQLPNQVVNQDKYKNLCDFSLAQEDLIYVDQSKNQELAKFGLTLITTNGLKNLTSQIYITFVRGPIVDHLPNCMIINMKQKPFDPSDSFVLYSKCSKFSQDQSFSVQNIKYQWKIEPSIDGVQLNSHKLLISPYQLFKGLTKKEAGNLNVILTISNTKTGHSYNLQDSYQIPKLYNGYPNSNIRLEVNPFFGYTLFTNFKISLSNHELQGNQYYRIRIVKHDDSQEILLSRTTNSSYSLSLPKRSRELYIDIIENKLANSSDYNIYTIEPVRFQIDDMNFLSKMVFNQYIKPRLLSEISIDYSDISQVENEIQNLFDVKIAISGVSEENRETYNQFIFGKFNTLYTKVTAKSIEYQQTENLKFKAKMFAIASLLYSEMTEAQKDLYEQVESVIINDFLSTRMMNVILDKSTSLYIKKYWQNSISNLIDYGGYDIKRQSELGKINFQIMASIMAEGDSEFFTGFFDKSLAQIYKVSNLDLEANSVLDFYSRILNDQSKIRVESQYLPKSTEFIEFRQSQANDSANYSEMNKTIFIAKSQLSMILKTKDLEIIDMNNPYDNFEAKIELELFDSALPYVITNDATEPSIQCVSKEDDDENFQSQVKNLIAQLDEVQNGKLVCISKHLSTFSATLYQTQKQRVNPIIVVPVVEQQTVFTRMPILKYLLPVSFFTFSGIMLLLGKVMSEMDKGRPKRMYNKLTFKENLSKHTYLRLLGSMILQFNPFFNFIFKPNPYLSRPTRLLILTCYFLMVSQASLLYFLARADTLLMGDVFWLAAIMQSIILVFRSKVQECLLSLFYPLNLTIWKYQNQDYEDDEDEEQAQQNEEDDEDESELGGHQIHPRDDTSHGSRTKGAKRSVGQKQNVKEIEMADFSSMRGSIEQSVQQSMRLEQSMNRLMPSKKNDFKRQDNLQEQEDEVRGDEIANIRKKKKSSKSSKIAQSLDFRKQPISDSLQRSSIVDNPLQSQSSHQEIELTEYGLKNQKKKKVYNKGYPDPSLQEEPVEQIFQKSGKQQKEDQQQQMEIDISLENDEEMKEETFVEHELEGGEKEEEKYQEYEDVKKVVSKMYQPDPNGPRKMKKEKQTKGKEMRKKPNKKVAKHIMNQNEDFTDINRQGDNEQSREEESTPSLENLYENYRELELQPTSALKRLLGICILLLLCGTLMFSHSFLLPNIQNDQFQNWFSCTSFTFLMMVFGIDFLLYALAAWALKRTNGKIKGHGFCSAFNWFVYWPLGRYKFMELEIELAKLKDFDKLYDLLAYAT